MELWSEKLLMAKKTPTYACYSSSLYYGYAKMPIGSDNAMYQSSEIGKPAKTSSELVTSADWLSLTEESGYWAMGVLTRHPEGDLYD